LTIEDRTKILGLKPKNGGSPPRDIIDKNVSIFIEEFEGKKFILKMESRLISWAGKMTANEMRE